LGIVVPVIERGAAIGEQSVHAPKNPDDEDEQPIIEKTLGIEQKPKVLFEET
jgi:hypothetical protein